ncbi:MAG TPA: cytochrome c [Acidobacteriaceae bacterium]|nr:cytochrome c [Acidobacteriaceae bacterium]
MNHWTRTAILASIALVAGAIASAQTSGADNYKAKCQMCHGVDGSGNTPAGKAMKAPSLKSPESMKMTDAELAAIIGKGKGKMPAYAGKLTSTEIKDVVAYIRVLQNK